ncbi:MAG: hypothetical protein R6W76_12235 [Caldilinea sp.]
MNTIVFAPKTFLVPTPRHASQTPEEIRKNFLALLQTNNAALLAIKQAALGQCVLVVNPSANQNANNVFRAVLEAMIAFHQQKAAEAAEAAAKRAESAASPPLVIEMEIGDDEAEIETAFA